MVNWLDTAAHALCFKPIGIRQGNYNFFVPREASQATTNNHSVGRSVLPKWLEIIQI